MKVTGFNVGVENWDDLVNLMKRELKGQRRTVTQKYICLPPFEVQLIVQLGTAVSKFPYRAGQSSIMKVFVLFTSNTFPGFNVFFKGILYINLSTIHLMVKTVGFLVDFHGQNS